MKTFKALVVFLFAVSGAYAQFRVGVQIGANLPAGGIAMPGFVEVDRDGTQHALVATLGAGINYDLSLGYQVHPNVIVGLDVGHFKSFKGGFHVYVAPNTDMRMEVEFTSKYTHVTPNVTLQTTKAEGKLQPFARFGIMMAGASVESTRTPYNIPDGGGGELSGKYISKYSGGTSLGLLGAVGAKKSLGERIDLQVELNAKCMTASPKKLENVQNFSGLEKDPTIDYTKTLSPDAPDNQVLTMTIPFSSFGLSIGVSYRLGQ